MNSGTDLRVIEWSPGRWRVVEAVGDGPFRGHYEIVEGPFFTRQEALDALADIKITAWVERPPKKTKARKRPSA